MIDNMVLAWLLAPVWVLAAGWWVSVLRRPRGVRDARSTRRALRAMGTVSTDRWRT